MVGVARWRAAALRVEALRVEALRVRAFGTRFLGDAALRGERGLRAMIPLTPARLHHAMDGPLE
jgi:hypothetical protein